MKTVLLDLDAAEARANAATSGPWGWYRHELRPLPLPQADEDGYRDFDGVAAIVETDGGYYGPNEADRAFIAAARSDVPALINQVRGLRAILKGEGWDDSRIDACLALRSV